MDTVNIKTIDGGEATFNHNQLTDFESGIRGRVIYADQHGYDQAREVWNGFF